MEMPMLSTRVAHATAYRGAINAQYRSNRQRRFEGCLDQQPRVARRWQEMADRTAIPRRIRRRRCCGSREQISRGGKQKRRGGGAAQKFATRRHGKLPEVSCRAEDAWYPVSHSYASHAQGQYWRSRIEAVKQVSHLLWSE